MSFFVSEHFNLPDGAFQGSIKTSTEGNGTVYSSDGWGVIGTFENTDGALIMSDKGLTVSEFATTPFRVTLKYKLSSLGDGKAILIFAFSNDSVAPTFDASGTWVLWCSVSRNGSIYNERWVYSSGGSFLWWDGASWAGSGHVRTISPDTEYTLTITFNPITFSFRLENEIDTAITGRVDIPGSDWWWFVGDLFTVYHFGILKFHYIIVEKIEVENTFISENQLLIEKNHANHFNGTALWALNDFTTEASRTITINNNILDCSPEEYNFISLNCIGESRSQTYTPSIKVLLNDADVTSRTFSYSITWGERFIKSLTIDFDQSISTTIYKKNNDDFRIPQIEIQVDHDSSGTYITRGKFFIEEVSELISNGKCTKRMSGRSTAALLDRPYSSHNTISYESTSKRAIVCGLVEYAGLLCNWSLPNGPIDYHTFDARTPIEIIEDIVSAVGGRISVDNTDHLYFYSNDFTPENESPTLSVDSSNIHRVRIVEKVPQSFNKITVAGRTNNMTVFHAWAQVELVSVDSRGDFKSTLAADGDDYAVLIATCYDPEGVLVDTELIEKEPATPSQANIISVSKRIAKGGVVGVWPDTGGGIPGAKIDGPYSFDGCTIMTTESMLKGPHLVSYHGGDTVSLSVEGSGVVEETNILIEDGQGRTKLYGNELAAGTITVLATYNGQDSNPVSLILGDPRVGDLDVHANPPSLLTSESSTITAMACDPDGDPVGDGYSVEFNILAGNGTLSAASVVTTTNTIENEEQVSNSYSSIRVENPISNLISIYALKGDTQEHLGATIPDDDIDTSFNYATGAATDGSTINLTYNLPKPQTRVVVTYESGGTAQVIYTAPSTVDKEDEEVIVEVWAGGLNHLVFIDVARKTASTPSVGGGKLTGSVCFSFDGTPTSADRGELTETQAIPISTGYTATLGSYHIGNLSQGITNGKVVGIKKRGNNVTATVQADKDRTSGADYWRGEYVTGSRQVYIENTDIPVSGARVTIEWNGGDDSSGGGGHTEENLTTNSQGVFMFKEGVSGTHTLTIAHANPQNPDAPLGFREYAGTITVAGEVGPNMGVIGDQVFYKHVSGSFTVPIIYHKK